MSPVLFEAVFQIKLCSQNKLQPLRRSNIENKQLILTKNPQSFTRFDLNFENIDCME